MQKSKIQPSKPRKKLKSKVKDPNEIALERLKIRGSLLMRTRDQKRKSQSKTRGNKGLNYLWTVFFVKKFVDILKLKTVESKLKRLDSYHWKVFNDVAYYPEEIQDKKYYINNPIYSLHVS